MKKVFCLLLLSTLCFAFSAFAASPKSTLGQLLFEDENLSFFQNQSCQSCHHPAFGFAYPPQDMDGQLSPVSLGSDELSYGGRNAPTAAYAYLIPGFHYNAQLGEYVGGQFWDGRAKCLKEQAKGPFLNPVEMAMEEPAYVLAAVADPANPNYEDYARLFLTVFGTDIDTWLGPLTEEDVALGYDQVAEAIANYERTEAVNPFSSSFDDYLQGMASLSADQEFGLEVFQAHCAVCHPVTADTDGNGKRGEGPALTNFRYYNLGLPQNPLVVELTGSAAVDLGLGAHIVDPDQFGKFKTPTLRNIALTAPYGHNGYFQDLDSFVAFLNDRSSVLPATPEVTENLTGQVGNLGLNSAEMDALVAFLTALSDTH